MLLTYRVKVAVRFDESSKFFLAHTVYKLYIYINITQTYMYNTQCHRSWSTWGKWSWPCRHGPARANTSRQGPARSCTDQPVPSLHRESFGHHFRTASALNEGTNLRNDHLNQVVQLLGCRVVYGSVDLGLYVVVYMYISYSLWG